MGQNVQEVTDKDSCIKLLIIGIVCIISVIGPLISLQSAGGQGSNDLSVSVLNSQDGNYTLGAQVIQVRINDSSINDTNNPKGEPDVTVNGKTLRMVQVDDGSWYAYFADRDMAQIADSMADSNNPDLDYGSFCNSDTTITDDVNSPVSFSDTAGIALPDASIGIQGNPSGGIITAFCGDLPGMSGSSRDIKVIKITDDPVNNPRVFSGQIGIDNTLWPFVQLFQLNSTNIVNVTYNKGGGAQSESVSIDPTDLYSNKYELKLDSGSWFLEKGFQIDAIKNSTTPGETDNFFFLQATHNLDTNEKMILENKGITLIDYLGGSVYRASANNTSLDNFNFTTSLLRSASKIDSDSKIESSIKNRNPPPWAFDKKEPSVPFFIIYFQKQYPPDKMLETIELYGEKIAIIEDVNAVSAKLTYENVEKLAKDSKIKFIRFQDAPLYPEMEIIGTMEEVKETIGFDRFNISELNGTGIIGLVVDLYSTINHPALKKIIDLNNTGLKREYDEHTIHVVGVLGANATVDSNKGVAPQVTIMTYGMGHLVNPQDYSRHMDKIDDSLVLAKNNLPAEERVDLMNLSLGQKVRELSLDCKYWGNYTDTARQLDTMVKDSKIIITKSAGNERGDNSINCANGITYATITSPATAKNPIVVGSIDIKYSNEDDSISVFSSFGPTDDERIKPDLVAPGAYNSRKNSEARIMTTSTSFATIPQESYTLAPGGTSLSAPVVGGIIALMEQKWEQRWEQSNDLISHYLFPHTAKAILIHTAKDVKPIGPDYQHGWGLVNAYKAINLISDSKQLNFVSSIGITELPNRGNTIIYDSLNVNDEKIYNLNLTSSTKIKLTLVWDDIPTDVANFSGNRNLVNNLDLSLLSSSKEFLPYTLKKTGIDEFELKQNVPDDKNNVEMIEKFVNEGNWKIKVSFKDGTNPQDFTLIVSTVPPNLQLESLGHKEIKQGQTLLFNANLTPESETNGVEFSLIPDTTDAKIDKKSGIFKWNVSPFQDKGDYNFRVIAKIDEVQVSKPVVVTVEESNPHGGGCLIATAAYGSELVPQIQQLRELRDNTILNTKSGIAFMTTFNQFYYSFSPAIADYERENPLFKEAVKIGITPMLSSLSILSLANSELEVIELGIMVISINIGMYVVLPVYTVIRIKKFFKK